MQVLAGINKKISKFPIWLLYAFGLFPAVYLFFQAFTDNLGADPLKVLEHQLGMWSLKLLIIVLLISPVKDLIKLNFVKQRRAIGLLSFYYACLHFLTYLVLDQQLDLSEILKDFSKRPYIIFGILSFSAMIPLAFTSSNRAIRFLGSKIWSRLHKVIYIAALFAATHFILLVKSWPIEPIVYCSIIIILIFYRMVTSKINFAILKR